MNLPVSVRSPAAVKMFDRMETRIGHLREQVGMAQTTGAKVGRAGMAVAGAVAAGQIDARFGSVPFLGKSLKPSLVGGLVLFGVAISSKGKTSKIAENAAIGALCPHAYLASVSWAVTP